MAERNEILIFDDDPNVSAVLSDSLSGLGYGIQLFPDNTNLLALARQHRPRLVILDVMLPGMDGIAACKALRADPELKGVRIAVVSGKTAGSVSEQALKHGADIFIAKPFALAEVLDRVGRLIGPPERAPLALAQRMPVTITVRGCRSSGPASSCLSLEAADDLILLDAGSGLLRADFPAAYRNVYALLTHYHGDHVEGLSALARINGGAGVRIFGPSDPDTALSSLVDAKCGGLRAKVSLIHESAYQLTPYLRLSCIHANHPGPTLALKLDINGKKIVYCPDNGIRKAGADRLDDVEKLKAFARGADLLIHDARYSAEDLPKHVKEGHSDYAGAVDLAVDAGVERLLLFHLDSSYSPAQLDAVESAAKGHASRQITDLRVELAREGQEISLSWPRT